MKIGQIIDTKEDQNEIESEHLVYNTIKRDIGRIDLSTLEIDIVHTFGDSSYISPRMALPNNQIYGLGIERGYGESIQTQFIIDDYCIKAIDPGKNIAKYVDNFFAYCYYKKSIFTFEYRRDFSHSSIVNSTKMLKHKWINLCPLPFCSPISCIGFKQKILIATDSFEQYNIWAYDIDLNSYSQDLPANILKQNCPKTMIKSKGKMYLIVFYEIYVTEDPFSEWVFVSYYQNCLVNFNPPFKVLHEGSIYYIRENFLLYEFNLANFKSKVVEDLKGRDENKSIIKYNPNSYS